jgi:glyoxylase-like metal-dependent hydrolase (beta-lactamase superfamily II)
VAPVFFRQILQTDLGCASYLIADPERLLSGDSLLVGSVARPDLALAAPEGAAALFETLHRLERLGDQVEVWPAHVAARCAAAGR